MYNNHSDAKSHLEVARFIVNTVSESVGTSSYMRRVSSLMQNNCDVQKVEDWLKPDGIVDAFEARAARMAVTCSQQLAQFQDPEHDMQSIHSQNTST
ncbi:hypothetical protein L6452_22042 [Arctium lappa]|uniref:Uncharacterized protein n=1 Tax=Arctium lappa TaxID=4217 RepID=A0ACB9B305_ARCLA|nr:hypothetical protein L6452_22042 [Arctium lappa]